MHDYLSALGADFTLTKISDFELSGYYRDKYYVGLSQAGDFVFVVIADEFDCYVNKPEQLVEILDALPPGYEVFEVEGQTFTAKNKAAAVSAYRRKNNHWLGFPTARRKGTV